MNRELMKQCLDALEAANRAISAEHVALITEDAIEALRAEIAKPEPESVALNWVNLQNAAAEIVRNKLIWKRFIDGTPLANDIACWMADFALEHAAHVGVNNEQTI